MNPLYYLTVQNVVEKIAKSMEPVFQARVAAALVYKNDILSIGMNKNKSHPFQKKYSSHPDAIYLHAETDAIYNAIKDGYSLKTISDSELVICRMKWEDGSKQVFTQGLAKPCLGCQRAIVTFDIKAVHYTLEERGYQTL
jgi:deoxycytidylate deaminase